MTLNAIRPAAAAAIAVLAVSAMPVLADPASAEPVRLGPLEIAAPWARASIGTSRPSAAYMTIRNTSGRPDRLLRVETPAAAQTEVHAMVEEDDVMRMRPAGDLEIPPGGELRLEPGGLHLMLMELARPLEEGGSLPLTLVFEQAGEVTIEAPIAGMGARAAPD